MQRWRWVQLVGWDSGGSGWPVGAVRQQQGSCAAAQATRPLRAGGGGRTESVLRRKIARKGIGATEGREERAGIHPARRVQSAKAVLCGARACVATCAARGQKGGKRLLGRQAGEGWRPGRREGGKGQIRRDTKWRPRGGKRGRRRRGARLRRRLSASNKGPRVRACVPGAHACVYMAWWPPPERPGRQGGGLERRAWGG